MIRKDDFMFFVCPLCKQDSLVYEPEDTTGDLIEKGKFLCKSCDVSFPIMDGIPYFMPPWELVWKEMGSHPSRLWQNRLNRFKRWRKKRYKKLEKNNIETKHEQKRFEENKRLFFEFCGEINGNILEIGCGGGWNKEFYSGRFFGIDPIVSKDGKGYDFLFCQGIGEFLPFKNQFFDSVMMIAMQDHVMDLDKSFEEAFRVLKYGGQLYIMTSVEGVKNCDNRVFDKPSYDFKTLWVKIYEKGIIGIFRSLYYRVLYSERLSSFLKDYTHTQQLEKEELLKHIRRYTLRNNIILEEVPDVPLLFLKVNKQRVFKNNII